MKSKDLVTVAWGGDVNLGRRFHYRVNEEGAGLQPLGPLGEADLTIVNLECVVATEGRLGIDKQERSSYYFRARPEMLRTLVEGGVDIVATANNHSGDYGPEALLEQADWLDSVGIGHTGSGPDLAAALRPVIRRVGNLNVAIFSLDATQPSFAATDVSPGHAYLSLSTPDLWKSTLEPLFSAARQQAHVILVAVHWGANNKAEPGPKQIATGHAIIDAGADAILGASAHRIQAVEIYKEKPIIHNAGDLLFDAVQRAHTDAGLFFLDLDINGARQVRFRPIEVGFCRSRLLHGTEAVKANARFASLCARLGTTFEFPADVIEGRLLLNPARRDSTHLVSPLAASNTCKPSPTLSLSCPSPGWIAEEVPEQDRLAAPVRLGPLELIGVRLAPSKLDSRGLLYVESYWRLCEATQEDWRLDFNAHPADDAKKLGIWGQSSGHDPCDWMWPTSRWQTGIIYRDFYSLRPSAIRDWLDSTLQLSVQLRTNKRSTERVRLPVYSEFSLSPQEVFSLLTAFPPKYRVFPPAKLAKMPTVLWTAEQLQQITGGHWINPPPPGWYVGSVSNVKNFLLSEGYAHPRLFVATDKRMSSRHELTGNYSSEKIWDHHQLLPTIQSQIGGAIVARQPSGLNSSLPLLQVEDPLQALIELGIAGRQRLRGKVVAITGSAGKTSLACMMTQSMGNDLHATTNAITNYNSRVGIFHLLANAAEMTDLVVMEMAVSAINAPGMVNLKLARPDIAVITNIAPSHLPPGKPLSYTAQRKGNIMEGISANGWVVICRETDYFDYLYNRAVQRKLNVVTYGSSSDADIRLMNYDEGTGSVNARLADGQEVSYALRANGLHMALNSLACLAVRQIIGKDIPSYLPALGLFEARPGRGKTHQVIYRGKQLTVIDDSYNANPLSMEMSLNSLRSRQASPCTVVLGDMLELGDKEKEYHQALLKPILELKPRCVLLCGKLMQSLLEVLQLADKSTTAIRWYKDAGSLAAEIDQYIENGSTVLIKGSNSVGLGSLVEKLTGTS